MSSRCCSIFSEHFIFIKRIFAETMDEERPLLVAAPRQTLSVVDAMAIIVGIVVGAGIFKTPSVVAASVESNAAFLLVWPLGGAISLVGALCYAELASAYPDAGGDYRYFTEYTAPVFWFFFLLAGVSLFVLRRKDPDTVRPFRVPPYPLTPRAFSARLALLCCGLVWSTPAWAPRWVSSSY